MAPPPSPPGASNSRPTRRTRDGDFYLATSEDLDLATYGDFLMAMDNRCPIRDTGQTSGVSFCSARFCSARRKGPPQHLSLPMARDGQQSDLTEPRPQPTPKPGVGVQNSLNLRGSPW